MSRQEELLSQIDRIATSGCACFDTIYSLVDDAGLRNAFAYMSEVKGKLISELKPWLNAGAAASPDQLSPAAMVEKLYRDAAASFCSREPAAGAKALCFGEEQLSRLVERAVDVSTDAELKNLLKTYYSQLLVCLAAMRRLRTLRAA